jgi:hypothetical protein
MLTTAILIIAGLFIVVLCVLLLKSDLDIRLNRMTAGPDGPDREQVEALRKIANDIRKGKDGGIYGL